MDVPTLMVLMALDRPNAPLCGVARDLAERMRASVIGFARAQPAEAVIMPVGVPAGAVVRAEIDQMNREAMAAEADFRRRIGPGARGARWDMAVTPHFLSAEIAKAACAADIVVVGLARDEEDFTNTSWRADVGDLIMQAGRPVLVVPPGIGRFDFGAALVAWKDCREARHALAVSLPLLRLMGRIVIAEITDESPPGDAQARLREVTGWLSRHGVAAEPRLAPSLGDDGAALLALADAEGAGTIVAGAYGHGRAREWALGGVTRTLLRRSECCVLLAH
jgi:nucleotide-binding universal stress UspA family protein